MNFYSDRIQSRITEIDRALGSVDPMFKTQNPNDLGQHRGSESIRSHGQNSQNPTPPDRSGGDQHQSTVPHPIAAAIAGLPDPAPANPFKGFTEK